MDHAIDGSLLLVFIVALVGYLRSDQPVHLEIPAMLGALAVSLVLPEIGRIYNWPPNLLTIISGSTFLLQPYLLLRLAGKFTRMHHSMLWVVATWLVLSWIVLTETTGAPRGGALLLVITYYAAVNAYAIFLFIRDSSRTRGVVRRRMLAIAFGTAAFMVAWLSVVVEHGPADPLNKLLSLVAALVASLGYVAGFTPPAWLKRGWQLPEIDRFIRQAPDGSDTDATLEHLARSARSITGARAVAVLETLATSRRATVRWYGDRSNTVTGPAEATPPTKGVLFAAMRGTPGVSKSIDDLPKSMQSWAMDLAVQEFSAIPIRNRGNQANILLVFANYGFLFAEDDIDLLSHLARHTAIACENASLLDAATHEAQRLVTVNRVMSALIHPMEPETLAREMLDVLRDAMGAAVAELFVVEPDGLHLTKVARRPEGGTPVRWQIGMGLPGEALQQEQVVFCRDVRGDSRFVRQEEAEREGYRSLIAVPLLAADHKVGGYTLIHKTERPYSPAEVEMLRALAAPITTALQNAMLHRTAEQRLRQFQLLHETSLALASEHSMDELLQQITDAARRLTGASYAALSTLDETGRIAQFVTAGVTEGDSIPGLPMPEGKGALNEVLRGGKPLRVADIAAYPGAVGIPPGHPSVRSFLGVPIAYREQILGMLYVANALEADEFSADDEWALLGLAAHAAVTINNTRLFARIDEARSVAERANKELEQANRAKSDFLASMSHELRTPLNAILGFTEIMLDDEALDTKRRQHFLDTVHSSGRHLLGLINDILDLSKVEAGQMDLQVEQFDAVEAVQEVLSAVEPLARQGEVDLVLGRATSVRIMADRGKFKQILYNLVSNAIKFSEQGGHVLIQVQQDVDDFTLAVEDTGIGIQPEDQERIFDAFQQVDSSSGRRYKGTGLGLALVRRYVELHGGQVTLRSTPGKGTRFQVYLPGTVVADATTMIQDERSNDDGTLILVVEDDPRAEALLRHTLESNGFRVASARNGEEALAKVKALHPAAVTLDVILPGIDGWAVLQLLKSDPETRDVPVVVVTIVDDQRRALALGACDFFLKPVDRGLLSASLMRFTRPPASEVTVLTVDDEPSALETTAGILRDEGYRAVTATDGLEALDKVRESPPDIVILDLLMPGMTGFDFLVELRREVKTSQIPVLVVTSQELTVDEKRRLSGEVVAVLHKGEYARSDLIHWIRDALSHCNNGGSN